MLKKVLKYDLKYTYKVLIIFYLLTLIFAIFTRILFAFDNSFILDILGHITSGATISFIFSILINNMMRMWARFVKNIYGEESYLTHTLPIEKKTIYISKVLSSIITMFTSILVILLAIIIAYYSKENLELLKNSLNVLASAYNSTIIKLILMIFFVFFLEMTFAIQAGYTGIILAHRSNNNRIVKSVIYGFICYLLTQAFTLLSVFIIGLFNKDIMNLFITNDIVNVEVVKIIMVFGIILYTLFIYIYYRIDIKLFEKGVNVE